MIQEAAKKTFIHKVYDSSGTYITTWANDVISVPKYTWEINGSIGNMTIELGRKLQDSDEGNSVANFNVVDTYITDNEGTVKIHSGFISSYEIVTETDGKEKIIVHVLPHTVSADRNILQDDAGNTTIDYTDQEPADIMKDILIKWGGAFTYNSSSMENTGTAITYTFKYKSYLEALKKVIEFCPSYWYWYIDGANIVYLSSTDFEIVDHSLFLGKEIQSINAIKSVEEMYNAIYFLGGDVAGIATYLKYTSAGSLTEYGELAYRMTDTSVIETTTAQAMAQKFLDEHDHFQQEMTITVIDNNHPDVINGDLRGYDIESIKPGDIISVNHPRIGTGYTLWYDFTETAGNFVWDQSFWDYDIRYSFNLPMQVKQISYEFWTATITLATLVDDLAKNIDALEQELLQVETDTIPDAPS